jgi:hypothetical protein
MSTYPALADYRRRVAQAYAELHSASDMLSAATTFRHQRDQLFVSHPMSALNEQQKSQFTGIPYAPYDLTWRIVASLDYAVEPDSFTVELDEDGTFRYQRFARVHFDSPTGQQGVLSLFWILGYGGGVFLPFGDTTSGKTTYGGGRYLYDTIKGADLGVTPQHIVLDFNFAYHPSCFYNPRWVCPLTPPENRLPFAVPVGELSER